MEEGREGVSSHGLVLGCQSKLVVEEGMEGVSSHGLMSVYHSKLGFFHIKHQTPPLCPVKPSSQYDFSPHPLSISTLSVINLRLLRHFP